MTAINNIRYFKSNIYSTHQTNSVLKMICKAIGADNYSISSLIRRFYDLHMTTVPTVIEISGIEAEYDIHKSQIDNLFRFLSAFSKNHRLVKFTVKLGSMRYVL